MSVYIVPIICLAPVSPLFCFPQWGGLRGGSGGDQGGAIKLPMYNYTMTMQPDMILFDILGDR